MTGIILMTIGVLIFAVGTVIYTNSRKKIVSFKSNNSLDEVIEMAIVDGVLTKNERNVIKRMAAQKGLDYDSIIVKIEQQIAYLNIDTAETTIIDINKKNGDDFEKYIVQKFEKRYFKIKEWAGDKYVKGIYASTTPQPDILFEIKLNNQLVEFSVECKWRSKYYQNGIEFASKEQLIRYQDFEKKRNIPVFIAIGIGGKGKSPEHLYMVPLKSITSNFISSEILNKYKKNGDGNFYFDNKTNELN